MNLNQSWSLKKVLNLNRFTKSEAYEIRVNFKSRLIRVDANFKAAKANWNRVGWLKQIHRNTVHPEGHLITFGSQFVLLSAFSPYTLRFTPVRWLPDGFIKIWEFNGDLSDELIDSFHSFITQGNPMPTYNPSDIRSFKKMLADQASMITQQAAQIATTGAKLVTLETTMVIERTFTVPKAVFALVDGVWVYDLLHEMNTFSPGVEIFDNGGDVQSIQTIVKDANILTIELSQLEHDENNFPFTVSLQAKNSPVVYVPGQLQAVPGGVGELRLLDGKVEFTLDGGVTVDRQVFPDRIASEAFISNGRVYATVENGDRLESVIGTWITQISELSDYNAAKASADVIIL